MKYRSKKNNVLYRLEGMTIVEGLCEVIHLSHPRLQLTRHH